MKKISIKNKIFKFFGLLFVISALMASVVFSVSRKTDTKVSSAVTTNYADAETYLANYATETGTLPEIFEQHKPSTSWFLLDFQPKVGMFLQVKKSLEEYLFQLRN